MSNFDANALIEKLPQETPQPTATTETPAATAPATETQQSAPVDTTPVTQTETAKAEVDVKVDEPVEWWEKQSEAKEEQKNVKNEVLYNNEELQAEIQKYRELDELLKKNPDLKAVVEGVKSNKKLDEAFSRLKGPDVDTMSPSDLLKYDLEQKGLTPEEVAEELEAFSEMSAGKQKAETFSIKERLAAQKEQRIQQLNQPIADSQSRQRANIEKASSELETISRELVGKEMYGVTITPEIVADLANEITNNHVIGDAENGYDIAGSMDLHFKAKYTSLIVKTNVTKAVSKVKENMLNDITRPDQNFATRTGSANQPDESAERKDAIKGIWG